MPTLSFIVPCFNEEDVFPQTVARLKSAGESTGTSFEIIVVDDGSTDRTWELIRMAAAEQANFLGIRLTRNFGQQAALFAGMQHSHGDVVVLLDADLQDPPEFVGPMLAKAREGYDVVIGVRRARAGESWLKRATAWGFHRVLNLLAPRPIPVDSGDFSLLSRRSVDALLAMPGRDRYLRALVSLLDFPKITIAYDRAPRAAGATHYTYLKLARIALHALTSSRRKPQSEPRPAPPLFEIRETTS